MRVRYDSETDAPTVIFADSPMVESDEDKPGTILDYDALGNLVSVEILDASLPPLPLQAGVPPTSPRIPLFTLKPGVSLRGLPPLLQAGVPPAPPRIPLFTLKPGVSPGVPSLPWFRS
jgi:uncharacterized protein YuzE